MPVINEGDKLAGTHLPTAICELERAKLDGDIGFDLSNECAAALEFHKRQAPQPSPAAWRSGSSAGGHADLI